MLTAIEEFSRFLFAIPGSDIETKTVITKRCDLFSIFGISGCIHSDRGPSFMSNNFKSFLHSREIATIHTTPYNPEGNGQCKRYNGTIWKTITPALKNHKLPAKQWLAMITDALHSVRTLISVSTNCTPHERLFQLQSRFEIGCNVTSWLSTPDQACSKIQI